MTEIISKAKFINIIKKYKDCELTFTSYNKYNFTYTGITTNNKKIEVSNYGSSDYVYRADLSSVMTLGQLSTELFIDYISIDGEGYEISLL